MDPHPSERPSSSGAQPGILKRLREAGLLPRKLLGQHFLHDPRILQGIASAAGIGPLDRVFEVGTGPGTLTRELARKASHVFTIDVDSRMLAFAEEELRDFSNVRFLCADVLAGRSRLRAEVLEVLRSMEPFSWVSNLPYGIASALIVAFCESDLRWIRAVLTLQDEVADRILAPPGKAPYGPLSALVAFWASARGGKRIHAGAFWPRPKVESRVVHLERHEPMGDAGDYGRYKAWVKRTLGARRKQIGRILRDALGAEEAKRFLAGTGWDPALRPGCLGPSDFLLLARTFPLE